VGRRQMIAKRTFGDLSRWLVQAAPDGYWVLDSDGRTVFANDRMAAILGRDPGEMPGLDAASTLDEAGQEQFRAHLRALEAGAASGNDIECSLLRKDGERFWALISHTPILDDDGRHRGWLHRVSEYTDQRRLVDILQRSEQQLAEAQSIAKIGSWEWDVSTDEVSWSDELYRIYGLSREEFVPTYAGFIDGIHPEDRDRVNAVVGGILADGESFEFDARILRGNGKVGWVRGRGLVARNESGAPVRMSGTAQDITEAKDAELALGLLRAMATAANDADTLAAAAPIAIGEVSRFTAWRAQAAFLVAPEGALTRISAGQVGPASGPAPVVVELAEEAVGSGAIAVRDQGDSLLLAAPLVAEGRVAGVLVLRREGNAIPEEWETVTIAQATALFARVAERELSSERLAAARDEAMSASRAKSEFLATMSHEIRTPLNGVVGLSELLRRTDLTERQRRLAAGIEQAGQALLRLVNDILDISKIEAGRLDLEQVDFDPAQVVRQSAGLVAQAARSKALRLVTTLAPDLPDLVRGDPVRFGQVVSNLLSNAVKFTAEGEVVVRVGVEPAVAVGVEPAAEPSPQPEAAPTVVRVEVRDTGPGVAEGERGRLFEAFSQADSSTTREFGGTGLGLAISRQIVGALGGEIGVDSTLGVGSTFWFTAVFEPPAHDGPIGGSNLAASLTGVDGARGRRQVLLVEDNPVNQLVAEGILASLGYAVVLAENGQDAVERFAEDPQRLDAVLMDCQMPVMDGYDATRAIRAIEDGEGRVPIIALTAAAVSGERDRCLAAGMDDFLTKPVDIQLLGMTLRRWLGQDDAPVAVRAGGPRDGGDERATAERVAAPPVDPEILDQVRLIELLDLDPGDPTMLLLRFIGRFGTNARQTLAQMREAQGAGLAHELGRLAHSLKGSAANLGAPMLAALCLEVEYLGEDGVVAAAAILDHVAEEIGRATFALEAFAEALEAAV
jgi:PAS domain S-box-containing protein